MISWFQIFFPLMPTGFTLPSALSFCSLLVCLSVYWSVLYEVCLSFHSTSLNVCLCLCLVIFLCLSFYLDCFTKVILVSPSIIVSVCLSVCYISYSYSLSSLFFFVFQSPFFIKYSFVSFFFLCLSICFFMSISFFLFEW